MFGSLSAPLCCGALPGVLMPFMPHPLWPPKPGIERHNPLPFLSQYGRHDAGIINSLSRNLHFTAQLRECRCPVGTAPGSPM